MTWRHTSVAGNMKVFRKEYGSNRKSRWHRGWYHINEAMGAYNMQKYREIITIVDKNEYQKLMNYIIKKDPEAFVTVYTVSDMRYRPKVRSF